MSVTLNEPKVISAATMLTFMHLYFLSDPDADKREIVTSPFNVAIIEPWADYITSKGGQIIRNSPIEGLVFKEGKVVSTTDEPDKIYDHFVLAADIPGVRSILSKSKSDPYTQTALNNLLGRANQIQLAPHYKVMRVWFQGRLNDSRPDILETPQHRPINLIARFDLLEKEFADWCDENNGMRFYIFLFFL